MASFGPFSFDQRILFKQGRAFSKHLQHLPELVQAVRRGGHQAGGYDVVGKTREECSAKIAKYFEDYGEWNEDAEWNDEEE